MNKELKEYIMSFSSYYKAAYAKDVLEQAGINSTLRRLPPQITGSCSTGVYLRTASIETVRQVLDDNQIIVSRLYEILKKPTGGRIYQRLR